MGESGPLLTHLREISQQTWHGEAARLLKNLIVYVEEHQEHMKYPEFLAKGYPIASGAIEGANKHILISRCRRAGQQFKRENAQHLLTLRTARLDNRWDEAMERVRQRQPQTAQPVAPPTIAVDAPMKDVPVTAACPKPPGDAKAPVTPLEATRRKLAAGELSLQAEIRRREIRRTQATLATNRGLRPPAASLGAAHP